MPQIPKHLRYTTSHEWINLNPDGTLAIGITDHAQEALGDLVFIELPTVGTSYRAGDIFTVIESVKAASDVYLPISGTVIAVNDTLLESPGQINADAYAAWIIHLKPTEGVDALGKLLNAAAYHALLEG